MFIDFVALMLINMVVGFVLLAMFVFRFPEHEEIKRLTAGFFVVGFIALATGFYTVFTWPLPGSYNISFGGLSVMFGMLLFAIGLALSLKWDYIGLAVYALFAGIVAILVGARIINLGLTKETILAGFGFIFSGLSALMALPVYYARTSTAVKVVTIIFILIAGIIWGITGYGAYWEHLKGFEKWQPPTLR
jgi:putative membrane protein